jgi:hypothetical protein
LRQVMLDGGRGREVRLAVQPQQGQ